MSQHSLREAISNKNNQNTKNQISVRAIVIFILNKQLIHNLKLIRIILIIKV